MSLISRLLGRKEPTVAVVERTKKHWRDRKCSGSGKQAMIPTSLPTSDGGVILKAGICNVCKRVLKPTKNNFLPSHLTLKDSE